MRRNHKLTQAFLSSILMVFIGLLSLQAQAADIGTGISYQGRLDDTNAPASGSYDFQFTLYDDVAAGTQVGNTLPQTLTVTDGIFNTTLDFGAGAFNNQARFLEIDVRVSGSGGYSTLSPRQAITTVPNASSVKSIGNVVTVAKSGGDYTTIGAALAAITATTSDRYLIRVAPGVYEETIDLESYVNIEGSGEGITIIRGLSGETSPFSDGTSATVRATGNIMAELRFLTVESDGTGKTFALGIYSTGVPGGNLKMTHVTVLASDGLNNYSIFNTSSSPDMDNVTATASGGAGTVNTGVRNISSSPDMTNMTVTASGGSTNYTVRNSDGSSPTIRNSTLVGPTSIFSFSSTTKVANSMLYGSVSGTGIKCIGAYNINFAARDENCVLIPVVYAIGDTGPTGGIVFYVTNGGLNGLEAAPADSADSAWGCHGTPIPGTSTAIGTGAANTAAIVAGCVSAEVTAAEVANDYSLNGFTGWFLPSKDELTQLYLQRAVVGGFASYKYWSSSENNSSDAWTKSFDDGSPGGEPKLRFDIKVRAVRAF